MPCGKGSHTFLRHASISRFFVVRRANIRGKVFPKYSCVHLRCFRVNFQIRARSKRIVRFSWFNLIHVQLFMSNIYIYLAWKRRFVRPHHSIDYTRLQRRCRLDLDVYSFSLLHCKEQSANTCVKYSIFERRMFSRINCSHNRNPPHSEGEIE